MKLSELRIGNLIYEKRPLDLDYRITDVRYIANDLAIEFIEPIPLTEEWLLKFGFKYTEIYVGFNQFRKGILELSITPNGYEIFFAYKWVKIEYVHQLQNLYFALTNEELTYEQQK